MSSPIPLTYYLVEMLELPPLNHSHKVSPPLVLDSTVFFSFLGDHFFLQLT